ncbi:hypothetical protein DV737_g2893, partial [Chaetothyriales sp. CBS 132003]
MGILKLALIGGAGYYAIKKLNENKNNENGRHHCGRHGSQQQQPCSNSQYPGQQRPQSQNREMSEGFPNSRPQQAEQKERYYDYEPNYQQEKKGPTTSERALPAPAHTEGGEQRGVWNEKGEYQRNY